MRVLFIIYNEVARRALNPVFDFFVKNNVDCRILQTYFCERFASTHESVFIDTIAAKALDWDFIISANPIKKDEFDGMRAVIHHGSMFGNNAWSLNSAYHSDIYFGLSPYEFAYIKRHLKNDFSKDRFVASGNPANDHLSKYSGCNHATRSAAKKEMGLKEGRTILLSSHWTSLGNLRKFGTGLVDALIWNFPDDQIICTCHPSLLTNPKNEFRVGRNVATPHFDAQWLVRSLENKAKQHDNIRIMFDEPDSARLLAAADIFIGDNSSFLSEASFFDVPLFANIDGSYFDHSTYKVVSSDVHGFSNIEDLIGGISGIDRMEGADVKTGKNIKKLFLYNLGFASQTIFDSLVSMKRQ